MSIALRPDPELVKEDLLKIYPKKLARKRAEQIVVNKVSDQKGGTVLDIMKVNGIQLIINTPSGKGARTDEGRIRAAAVSHGVPCITTIQAADAAVLAMEALRQEEMTVQAIQDRFPKREGPAKK